jgi:hypothetical protein
MCACVYVYVYVRVCIKLNVSVGTYLRRGLYVAYWHFLCIYAHVYITRAHTHTHVDNIKPSQSAGVNE